MKDIINYYVEFMGRDGRMHYAVHKYNNISKDVTGMFDLKFDY